MAVPTSADVARRAKVSRATVSYVLNGVRTQKISDETRDAVRRAAEELGYRPNLAAQSLATGASNLALFVIPSVHLGELAIVISSHLTARAAERGMNLIVHFESPASRAVIEVVRDLRPRAVVSMFPLDDATDTWLRNNDIRVSSTFPGMNLAATVGDRSGWLQVRHLIDNGHSRIAFADTQEVGLAILARARRLGVSEACRRWGLPDPPSERFQLDGHGADEQVRGWVAAGVTAVAAYNDEVAVAVLAGIRRAGFRCPDDLAVIGVDEMSINGSMEPPLSSIEFDVNSMAAFLAAQLSETLDEPARQPVSGQLDDSAAGGLLDMPDERFMRVMARESTIA